jgi:outer membrane protein assembly factor BamB
MRFSAWPLCLLLLGTVAAFGNDNWPNLHGPTHDGHSDSKGLPLTWSETENVVWKTPIHDSGWSSPVVWGKQVWLTTATDDGKQSFVVCVDRDSGQILLDRKLFDNENPEDTRKYNSFASPTAAIEEGRVYVSFGSYGIACLDTQSFDTVWSRRDLPCLHWRGPGSSFIVFENLLITHYDGYDHQYAIALDKQTGKTVWKSDRTFDYGTDNGDFKKAYCTPVVINVNGQLQLISATSKAALALDPHTGKEIWHIRYDEFSVAARPLYGHGLVFINSGFGKAKLFAVKPDGTGNQTANIVWSAKQSLPSKPSSLLIGDLIFSMDDRGVATCIEALTGDYVWTERVGGEFSSSPVYVDGRIYFFDHTGKTTVIAPERTYTLLAANQLADGFRASPAVAGKAFFLRTEKALYRIERK